MNFASGDILGIAFDADNGNMYLWRNGVAQNDKILVQVLLY